MGMRGQHFPLPAGRAIVTFLQTIVVSLVALASSTALVWMFLPATATGAAKLPSGFQESVVFGGLNLPTAVEFSGDGRVFVTEKSGIIKVFDNLSDTTPTTFADLRTEVYNRNDRGLLGLALDPNFPTQPYVYVSYSYDAPIGGVAPHWGRPGVDSDPCPTPPGATEDGCVISGRVARLTVDTNGTMGQEKVLVEDWCQQYPSHSMGDLAFGSDGALYASGGDGAAWNFTDYGQRGDPLNPCGDPPAGVGGVQTPPTAEGGSLRSQDLRTPADPTGLDGTIVRLDPQTGSALPDNPLASSSDANAQRIVAYGLRNPFRFTIKPGTNQVWIGNVGGSSQDEIEALMDPKGSPVENFGWPCYNGTKRFAPFDSADLDMCENLYANPDAVTKTYYAHNRNQPVVQGETCPNDQDALSGLAFYDGGNYPAAYDGALFFADYSRHCIWAMFKGANGLPDPTNIATFMDDGVDGLATPVDLEIGPGGDLFYVNIGSGDVRRIHYLGTNQPPEAVAQADPTKGAAPLNVSFDASGSSDPEGDSLAYAWDLDDDGAYDDATSAQATWTYTTEGSHTARLKVTDSQGATDTATVDITVGDPPTATIDTPLPTTTWKVGDEISFSGSASDPQEGQLPASALSWSVVLHHCPVPENCHQHPVQDFPGVASGSFVTQDHEYPSYFEIKLTATDSTGQADTKTVRLDPQAVQLSFQSNPTGLQLLVGDSAATATPFSRTVIVGSTNSISAPSPQTLAGTTYEFASWSDGGAQSHDVTAGVSPSTYTATYEPTTQDTTAPTVTNTVPADQATGVDAGTNATATFSEAMDASTVNGSTFKLWRDADATRVAAAVSYDASSRTATLDPSSNLQSNTRYKAVISTGVKDLAGNAMGSTKRWFFTTADTSDTTPPAPPSVDLVAASDTGISSTDDLTSDATPTFGGKAEANSKVEIFDSNGSLGTTTANDTGDYSFTVDNARALGEGKHQIWAQAQDAGGNKSELSATLEVTVDRTAPATEPPDEGLVDNSRLGASSVPVKLTWSATDDNGIGSYQLQQSSNGGASYSGVTLPSATATEITRSLAPGGGYAFRVSATDRAGNQGAWAAGATFEVATSQESDPSISYVGTWNTQSLSSAYGGALRYASGTGNERASFTFTGDEVAWVARTGPKQGQAEVWVDGTKAATVDLYSPTVVSRPVVFSEALPDSGSHTLEIRVLGTKNASSSGKRVDVDAFVVLR